MAKDSLNNKNINKINRRGYIVDNYKFNKNKKCEYFPCHTGVAEEEFNCLFCYCPLYMLENKCGGNFKITNGVKDCSSCTKPHNPNSFDFIMAKMGEVIKKGSSFIKGDTSGK